MTKVLVYLVLIFVTSTVSDVKASYSSLAENYDSLSLLSVEGDKGNTSTDTDNEPHVFPRIILSTNNGKNTTALFPRFLHSCNCISYFPIRAPPSNI